MVQKLQQRIKDRDAALEVFAGMFRHNLFVHLFLFVLPCVTALAASQAGNVLST